MRDKTYYVPSYHKFVHCHEVRGNNLVFGLLTVFYNDCKNSFPRQEITKQEFLVLKPIEVVWEQLFENGYTFAMYDELTKAYRVTQESEIKGLMQGDGFYFKKSPSKNKKEKQ